jgi:glutamyl-tRNA synthetase
MVDFLFLDAPAMDEDSWRAAAADEAAVGIVEAVAELIRHVDWNAEALHAATQAVADAAGRKLRKAQAPVRVAITGRGVGPPLFQSLEVLGREAVLKRLGTALDRLRDGPG